MNHLVRREFVKHGLSALNCDIVTGGGPGLIQAANEGAARRRRAKGEEHRIRVHLPFEQDVNPSWSKPNTRPFPQDMQIPCAA